MSLNNLGLGFAGLNMSRVHTSFDSVLNSPGLRAVESISKRYEALLGPTRTFASFQTMSGIAASFPALTCATVVSQNAAWRTNSAFMELAQQQRHLLEATSIGSLVAQLGIGTTPPLLRTLGNLERSLAPLLPGSTMDGWQRHLAASVGPMAAAFSESSASRFAVLAALPPEIGGALVNWHEDDVPRAAALIRPHSPTRLRHVEVEPEIEICCGVCGEPTHVLGGNYRWKGNRWLGSLKVIPVCTNCLKASGSDLRGYAAAMLDCLDDATKVQLRLVTGGVSDGVARGRGRLHLVQDDDEPEY